MIAYAETYVAGAQQRLGTMLDFAVNALGAETHAFYENFLSCPISTRFAAGDPAVVAGRSGTELALEVFSCSAERADINKNVKSFGHNSSLADIHGTSTWPPTNGASPEYWCGWALAFYQWSSGYSFSDIERRVNIDHILSLYAPYHEMDVRQFCDRMDELARQAHPQTNLQAYRQAAGLSQRQLAQASGVPLRTLQQYEQRQKNINHARADYLEALARTLGCQPRNLFEHTARSGYEYAVVKL